MARNNDARRDSGAKDKLGVQARSIRALNDRLRRSHEGGMLVITAGILERGHEFVARALLSAAAFDSFNEANDPRGEHDFGRLVIDETPVVFKIDYYDRSLRLSSGDPSDPVITRRVMTIMHAAEY